VVVLYATQRRRMPGTTASRMQWVDVGVGFDVGGGGGDWVPGAVLLGREGAVPDAVGVGGGM
jgi:hypothetical protein